MISKLIVWAEDRNGAIARMDRALREYRITGVRTTIPFGRLVMKNDAFRRGEFDTSFVDREFDEEALRNREKAWQRLVALAAAWVRHNERTRAAAPADNGAGTEDRAKATGGNWKATGRRRALR
jgi:acetyl-CoA carboxylase biotin carboxylase subunit